MGRTNLVQLVAPMGLERVEYILSHSPDPKGRKCIIRATLIIELLLLRLIAIH